MNSAALPGAALTVDLWPEGGYVPLGRVDFHGRWLDWQAPDPMFAQSTAIKSG